MALKLVAPEHKTALTQPDCGFVLSECFYRYRDLRDQTRPVPRETGHHKSGDNLLASVKPASIRMWLRHRDPVAQSEPTSRMALACQRGGGSKRSEGFAVSTKWKPGALRLMNAAEQLMAQQGVDEVSLIQIARSAGHANKYAVQYHFGNKDELISAIFEDRLSRINNRRRIILEEIESKNYINVKNLIIALFVPVFQETDENGRHSYALFTRRVMDYPKTHKIWDMSVGIFTGSRINNMLTEILPNLSPEEFRMRILLAVEHFYSAISFIDRNLISSSPAYASRFPAEITSAESVLAMSIEFATQILERKHLPEIDDITCLTR